MCRFVQPNITLHSFTADHFVEGDWWHFLIYMAIPESHAEEEFHTTPLQWEPAVQWELAGAIYFNVTVTRQSLEGNSDRAKKKK